jgi:hypothetical protein
VEQRPFYWPPVQVSNTEQHFVMFSVLLAGRRGSQQTPEGDKQLMTPLYPISTEEGKFARSLFVRIGESRGLLNQRKGAVPAEPPPLNTES